MKSCRVEGAGSGGGGVTWFNTGVEDDGSVAFAIGGAPAAAKAAAKGTVAIVVVGAAAAAKALTVPARGSPAVGFVPPGGAISLSVFSGSITDNFVKRVLCRSTVFTNA